MPKTTIFIGSSSASKSQAKAIIKEFESATLKFLPWWEAFKPGDTLMAGLDSIAEQIDAAMFVFCPEAELKEKNRKPVVNQNVLFEFGYFYGYLGKERVAMIKYGDFFLPSDFGGYIWISGSKHFTRNKVVQIGQRTKTDFEKWIQHF